MPFPPSRPSGPNSSQARVTSSTSKVRAWLLSRSGSSLTRLLYVGVAYQLVEDDPLVNKTQCQLDASLMKQLGANSIRVYHVDPSGDHSGCMNAFAQNNIYVWVDMDSFKTYIQLVREPHFCGKRQAGLQDAGWRSFVDKEQIRLVSSCHGQLPAVRQHCRLFRGQRGAQLQ